MSEIVCQVGNRADQVEFIWSSRGGYFKPYVVAGTQLTELRQAADQTRNALESLVFALNRDGAATPWEPSFELAEAGFRLFNYLLPSEDETAHKVRRWLEDLRKQSGLIGLEVVVEERSADAGTFLSVPWNLVYDERPAKYKAAFQKGQGVERWRPFWSVRYNLTSGRRVEPLKRLPLWIDPRVIVVVDPTVHEDLNNEQKGRLDGFLAEAGLTAVGSMDELEAALEEGYPRLLYWLGHATPEYLMLGDTSGSPRATCGTCCGASTTASGPRGCWRSSTPARRPRPGRAGRSWTCCTASASPGRSPPSGRRSTPSPTSSGWRSCRVSCARASRWASCCTVCGCNRRLWASSTAPTARPRSGSGSATAPPSSRRRCRSGRAARSPALPWALATLPADGLGTSDRRSHMGHADAGRRASPARRAVPLAGLSTTRRTAPCSPAATPTSCGSPRRWTGRIRGS